MLEYDTTAGKGYHVKQQNEPVFSVVVTTCPDMKCARSLASTLISQKIAACVNILPGVQSIYEWQGEVEDSSELLLMIKTRKELIEAVFCCITREHPYECPELLSLPIETISEAYGKWLFSRTKAPGA